MKEFSKIQAHEAQQTAELAAKAAHVLRPKSYAVEHYWGMIFSNFVYALVAAIGGVFFCAVPVYFFGHMALILAVPAWAVLEAARHRLLSKYFVFKFRNGQTKITYLAAITLITLIYLATDFVGIHAVTLSKEAERINTVVNDTTGTRNDFTAAAMAINEGRTKNGWLSKGSTSALTALAEAARTREETTAKAREKRLQAAERLNAMGVSYKFFFYFIALGVGIATYILQRRIKNYWHQVRLESEGTDTTTATDTTSVGEGTPPDAATGVTIDAPQPGEKGYLQYIKQRLQQDQRRLSDLEAKHGVGDPKTNKQHQNVQKWLFLIKQYEAAQKAQHKQS